MIPVHYWVVVMELPGRPASLHEGHGGTSPKLYTSPGRAEVAGRDYIDQGYARVVKVELTPVNPGEVF